MFFFFCIFVDGKQNEKGILRKMFIYYFTPWLQAVPMFSFIPITYSLMLLLTAAGLLSLIDIHGYNLPQFISFRFFAFILMMSTIENKMPLFYWTISKSIENVRITRMWYKLKIHFRMKDFLLNNNGIH